MSDVQKKVPPTERNAGRPPQPAILTISCLFVTCPSCSSDLDRPAHEFTTDWNFDELAPFTGAKPEELRCPYCGQAVTISLPRSLPVNP